MKYVQVGGSWSPVSNPGRYGAELTVRSVGREEAGEYRCTATNDRGGKVLPVRALLVSHPTSVLQLNLFPRDFILGPH